MRSVVLTTVLALSFIGCSIGAEAGDSDEVMGASAISGGQHDGDDANTTDNATTNNRPAAVAPITPPGATQTPCARTTTSKTGFTTEARTIQVGGQTRKYLLVVPGDYDNCKKYPVVLALHGDGDTGTNFHSWMTFENASKNEAILIYPDGQNNTWNLTSVPSANNDIQFINAALAEVGRSYTLELAKVYATGFSSGGFMSNALACQQSNVIRAIASNSGGAPFNQAQRWTATGWDKCVGQAPVATLHVHGGTDTTVPTASGRFAAQYWASVNSCATTLSAPLASNGACKTYDGCPAGKAVQYCEVAGMGHTEWEQTPVVAWAFFKAQA